MFKTRTPALPDGSAAPVSSDRRPSPAVGPSAAKPCTEPRCVKRRADDPARRRPKGRTETGPPESRCSCAPPSRWCATRNSGPSTTSRIEGHPSELDLARDPHGQRGSRPPRRPYGRVVRVFPERRGRQARRACRPREQQRAETAAIHQVDGKDGSRSERWLGIRSLCTLRGPHHEAPTWNNPCARL